MNVRGREHQERIYEIFNADQTEIRTKKEQISIPYHKGLKAFHSQKWDDSIKYFEECLTIFPQDAVSQEYLNRCKKLVDGSPAV